VPNLTFGDALVAQANGNCAMFKVRAR